MTKNRKTVKKKVVSEKEINRKLLFWSIALPVLLVIAIFAWQHRAGLSYLMIKWFEKDKMVAEDNSKFDIRNIELMRRHNDKIFGIDVSQYQGNISWSEILTINDEFPIDFIYIRATMGEKAKDSKFKQNWKEVKNRNKLRGAYHYFRPNENSIKQANNFIKTVELEPGDLPPVLDIEEMPRNQSMDSLKTGLKRWLTVVEKHYEIKPVLYSGDKYFADFLEKEFADYTLWIANYNFWIEKPKKHWNFWQFSEKGTVKGIKGPVDLNLFNGNIEELEKLSLE
ncbi:glycoside hydrolase family 25 protein [Sphingobacterium cellulitidis]|uniref:Glycosyl hydrolase n=1 Tax=Sphingobacterium cellulitidis TaxID=1768011 RepID=A0A8H9KX17_9SPHI|nr:glycoside hydrolase family 25 protein [Sphingobacterium soli]MBA8988298.1 lysozyme [Sphingobacterium soli]GGE32301.1 glycosyl hydrolase [Sphingobacterium soli]